VPLREKDVVPPSYNAKTSVDSGGAGAMYSPWFVFYINPWLDGRRKRSAP
jgi:hypothetical protein